MAQTMRDPGRKGFAITKSDTTVYEPPTRALWVGGAGDVAVVFADDDDAVTLEAVAAGSMLPVAVKQVMSTNTDATAIVGIR